MKNGCSFRFWSQWKERKQSRSSPEQSSFRFGHVMREFRTHLKTRFPNLSLTPRRAPHGSRENNVSYSSPSVVPPQLPLLVRILRGLLRYLLCLAISTRCPGQRVALPRYKQLWVPSLGHPSVWFRNGSEKRCFQRYDAVKVVYGRRTFPLSFSSLIPILVRYSIHRLHICYRRSNHLSI